MPKPTEVPLSVMSRAELEREASAHNIGGIQYMSLPALRDAIRKRRQAKGKERR